MASEPQTDVIDVFLSYARDDDADFVKRLNAYLEEQGLRVWFDRESMSSRGNPFSHEIKEAIAASQRVALVIGPKALTSPYVANEWTFALQEGKPVTPLLRGPFSSDSPFNQSMIPGRLRRLHRVECQTSVDGEVEALREVARVLSEQVGALGQFYSRDKLPDWYVWRVDLLEAVVDAVRSADAIAVTEHAPTTGQPLPVVIQGMAGAGKTMLAQAVARDGDVRRLFPDGIFWVEIGRTPAIAKRQGAIASSLTGQPEEFSDQERGHERLNALLKNKASLFILDDVWDQEDVSYFRVDAHACQILLTTRLRSVASEFRGLSAEGEAAVETDLLTEEEALDLLTRRLKLSPDQAASGRANHVRLAHLLGRHAQAVSIASAFLLGQGKVGGTLVDKTADYLDLLERQRARGAAFAGLALKKDDRNLNLEVSLGISYKSLPPEGQRRFRALGAFAEARLLDIPAASLVWGELADDAATHLQELFDAALLDRPEDDLYRQHMLLRMYSHAMLEKEPAEFASARERHHACYLDRVRAESPSETDIDQALFALANATDKIPLFKALIPHLSPYVFRGVQSAFVQALQSVEKAPAEHSGVSALADRLASTTDGQANRLVVAALAEHCRSQTSVVVIGWLDRWLKATQGEGSGLAARSAAQVAVMCRHEALLKRALMHRAEAVRNVVINDAHELWRADPDLVERLLNHLTGQIGFRRILNLKEVSLVMAAAVNFSVLLVLGDYAERGQTANVSQPTARQSLTVVQNAWRPVIRSCLMVNSVPLLGPLAKQVRRTLINLLASISTNKLESIGKRKYFTYSFGDIKAFMPASDEQRQAVDTLIDYMAPDELHTIDGLTNCIYDLAVRGTQDPAMTNWVMTMVAQFALLANMHRAPMATAHAIYALLGRLEQLYPPTTDPDEPTASLWYLVCTYPYLSFPYTEPSTNPADARSALAQFMEVSLVGELRYRNSWLCASGKPPLRVSNLEQYLFGYKLGIDALGKDVLIQTLLFDIEKDDRTHIAWSPYSIAIGMKRYQAMEAGIRAFEDMMTVLLSTDYFARLSKAGVLQFWQKAANDLILYAGDYQQEFSELFKRLREKELPRNVREALQETENRLSVNLRDQATDGNEDELADTQTGEAMAWAVRNALYDRDPYFRNLLRWFLHEAARASRPEDAMAGLMQRVINGVYGEEIF